MDGFSGYNQIKIYLDDEKYMSFRTPLGVFFYTVMPFGLKNTGATYQRAMSKYSAITYKRQRSLDDIALKSCDKNNHLHELKIMFDLMRVHQLKMNRQSHSWEFQVASSLDSLSHPKEFILTLTRSKPSKICSFKRISKNSGVYKVDWPTFINSS